MFKDKRLLKLRRRVQQVLAADAVPSLPKLRSLMARSEALGSSPEPGDDYFRWWLRKASALYKALDCAEALRAAPPNKYTAEQAQHAIAEIRAQWPEYRENHRAMPKKPAAVRSVL